MIYSFFDMAGDVGGFGEFIYVSLLILVGGYANRMFYAELIRGMFRVRLDTSFRRGITELMKTGSMKRQEKRNKRTITRLSGTSSNKAAQQI